MKAFLYVTIYCVCRNAARIAPLLNEIHSLDYISALNFDSHVQSYIQKPTQWYTLRHFYNHLAAVQPTLLKERPTLNMGALSDILKHLSFYQQENEQKKEIDVDCLNQFDQYLGAFVTVPNEVAQYNTERYWSGEFPSLLAVYQHRYSLWGSADCINEVIVRNYLILMYRYLLFCDIFDKNLLYTQFRHIYDYFTNFSRFYRYGSYNLWNNCLCLADALFNQASS